MLVSKPCLFDTSTFSVNDGPFLPFFINVGWSTQPLCPTVLTDFHLSTVLLHQKYFWASIHVNHILAIQLASESPTDPDTSNFADVVDSFVESVFAHAATHRHLIVDEIDDLHLLTLGIGVFEYEDHFEGSDSSIRDVRLLSL